MHCPLSITSDFVWLFTSEVIQVLDFIEKYKILTQALEFIQKYKLMRIPIY